VSRESTAHYTWGDGCDGWHLLRSAALSVIHERMPPRTAEVRHRHRLARQLFFVLDGELSVEVEGVHHTVGPRCGLEVMPGAAHEVRNDGPVAAEFLVVSAPPSHGDRELAPSGVPSGEDGA